MGDALDRVIARAGAHTAAAPMPPAAPEQGPPPTTEQAVGDAEARIADLEAGLADLTAQFGQLQQMLVEDQVADLETWTEPSMAAALPVLPELRDPIESPTPR